MIYRKMEHSTGTENEAPRDSTMANQQLPTKKSKPSPKTHHSEEEPQLQLDPPIKIPLEKNPPQQGRSVVGTNLNPNPIHKEGPTPENLKVLETLLSNRYIPQVLETRGEGQVFHPPGRQTTGRYHFQRRRDRANLRASISIYPSPFRSSSTIARDGSKSLPAS